MVSGQNRESNFSKRNLERIIDKELELEIEYQAALLMELKEYEEYSSYYSELDWHELYILSQAVRF